MIFASLLIVFVSAAYADQFESCRCKNGLATIGDPRQEVLTECGQPIKKEAGYVRVRGQKLYVEKWIYNFGPTEFMQAIAFDNSGKVVVVESLGRGY